MYIDLYSVQHALEDYESKLFLHDHSLCLEMLEPLEHALYPYYSHTIYIARSPELLRDLDPIPYMSILVLNPEKEDLSSYHIYKDCPMNILDLKAAESDFGLICNRIRDFLDDRISKGLAAESLMDSLYRELGIQKMIDEISPAFENPVYLFDSNFNLLACNYEVAEKTASGKKIIASKGFTDDEYRIINSYGHIHERLKKTETPIRVFHKETGFEQLLCAIDTRKDMGHLVIDGINRPIQDSDARLLYILKTGIYQQFQKDEFIRKSEGFHYEYFLRSLLDKKVVAAAQSADRIDSVNKEFAAYKYCLVVHPMILNDTLNHNSLRQKFSVLIPGAKTMVYQNQVIVILSFLDDRQFGKKEKDSIQELCRKESLFAGISNAFTDIMDFCNYYQQAIIALEIGSSLKNQPALYAYEDYHLQHLANVLYKEKNSQAYCSPKLKKLLKYDAEHDTEFALTLYTFLIHERRTQEAADALKIHRNTLNYRLRMMDSLVSINYESYEERQYLILSYEIYRRNYHPVVR